MTDGARAYRQPADPDDERPGPRATAGGTGAAEGGAGRRGTADPREETPPEGVAQVSGVADLLPDASELTPWQQYVLLLRRLDAERAADQEQSAAQRDVSRSVGEELERLGPEVVEQGGDLHELAVRLGLRRPRLAATPPAAELGAGDRGPEDLVTAAAAAVRRADAEASRAMEAGRRAAILANWPPKARNVVVYLAWALPGLLLQFAMISDGNASPLTTLVVVPLITFVGGLVTVGPAGRVRLAPQKVERSARMGALVCFGLFPLAMIVTFVVGLLR